MVAFAMNRPIHFEIQADDPARVQHFYENALGWKFRQAMTKGEGGMNYWLIETGEGPGINGGLYERSAVQEPFHLYDCTILVENIDHTIAAVRANGGAITKEKSEIQNIGFFAGCKDSEGNRFGLMQSTGWEPR